MMNSETSEAITVNDMVPRKTLVRYGSQGIGGLVGLALSRSKDDRTAGLVTLAAGAATALTAVPFLGGVAGSLLGIGGIGLLVVGGINLFKFIRGYRSRS